MSETPDLERLLADYRKAIIDRFGSHIAEGGVEAKAAELAALERIRFAFTELEADLKHVEGQHNTERKLRIELETAIRDASPARIECNFKIEDWCVYCNARQVPDIGHDDKPIEFQHKDGCIVQRIGG